MDILSLFTGFLGAAGSYLADKFTDKRREKDLAEEQEKIWQYIENRFPSFIEEMRQDFSTERNSRAFFVKTSNTTISFFSEPCFEYHTDKHPDIHLAVLYLAKHNFISEITLKTGSCPMYRIHEKLVDRLMKPNNSLRPTPLRGSA